MMTARDLALLAKRTIDDFPGYYAFFSEKKFSFNGIEQNNRNPLLYKDIDADGLKTGHTKSGGYGLTASAIRDGRRLILVINGLESTRDRSNEAARLIEYGFREFRNYTLLAAGTAVVEAEVWLGDTDTVPLVVAGDLTVTLPVKARKKLEAKVVYEGPLSAPIARGTQVATLVLSAPDMPAIEVPLQTGADVGEISIIGRMGVALAQLIFGSLPTELPTK
jgi:D-alanyl-D-alanine carboxypeptidase (penicillin-binding protein 5/6)